MKIGDHCNTRYGAGEIVHIEHFSRINGGLNRYGLKLVNNPFKFEPVYFFPEELSGHTEHHENL
ncbi:hypothetical protein [Eoetvoesiella caeni]|uniref:hypothetical protein n=1 Tax=Eoetvoesiella caeni TaxID=645616 RepID=UPI001475F035|nr:hypothetical protein [Eoetvoesiella caeni]MCI2811306.1 hypothetical protein [Eoetvoesiella caeni]NYT57195.1 hypothetical protein [Eoetvoesiella caeni]